MGEELKPCLFCGAILSKDNENDWKCVAELEEKIHKARNLWCDSKRDPETKFVDIKYLDQFEEAIK